MQENKILKAKDKIKATKSKGPDNLHPKLVKKCRNTVLAPLNLIFEKSLDDGKTPEIRKLGRISAI